jgi:hypothetical protein
LQLPQKNKKCEEKLDARGARDDDDKRDEISTAADAFFSQELRAKKGAVVFVVHKKSLSPSIYNI